MQPRVVGRDPLPAELVGLASDLGVPEAPSDTVASLEHDDVSARRGEPVRRDEPGYPGADDGDIRVDLPAAHRRATEETPSAAAAAARPVRIAPSMYPATH